MENMELESVNKAIRDIFHTAVEARQSFGNKRVKSELEKYLERYSCSTAVPFISIVRPLLEPNFPGIFMKYEDSRGADVSIQRYNVI